MSRDSAQCVDWHNKDITQTLKDMRSEKGGHLKQGSHHWLVAAALLRGEKIDDYRSDHGVFNEEGYRVNNIRSRVAQLQIDWGMPICSEQVEGKKYKVYWLCHHDNDVYRDKESARSGQSPVRSVPNETAETHGGVFPDFDWEV